MAVRDVFHQFASPTKATLAKWTAAVIRDDEQLAAKRAEKDRVARLHAEALAADEVDADLVAAHSDHRRALERDIEELGSVRQLHMEWQAEAQEREDDRIHAKERAEQHKIAETKARSFAQGVGEVGRAIDKIAGLLPQLHEAREQAFEAAQRLQTLTGADDPVFDIDGMIRNAGPAYALAALISPASYDLQAEFPRLDTAFAERAAAAKASYEIDIGLRQPEPEPAPDPAIAEEEARRAAAAEAHQRYVQSPEYEREKRAKAGSAPSIPGVVPTPTLTAQGGFTPEFLEQQTRAHRQRLGGARTDPHTGRAA